MTKLEIAIGRRDAAISRGDRVRAWEIQKGEVEPLAAALRQELKELRKHQVGRGLMWTDGETLH